MLTFSRLISCKPGSRKAEALRARLEGAVMQVLREKGLRASMRAVERAGPPGLTLETTIGGYREFVWRSEDQRRKLMISVHSTRFFKSTHVLWEVSREVPRTPREKALDEQHAAFYARYERIAAQAYGPRPPRLSKDDRTILLIGEFEADVNNGGFSQYIDNKGRRRAGETLRALQSVGANKTAKLLQSALAPGTSDDAMQKLDAKFYAGVDDLALLCVKHVT